MSLKLGTTNIAGMPTGLIDNVNGKVDVSDCVELPLVDLPTSYISGLGMPSSRYIDLTLGTSGTTYTAPANGWFVLNKQSGGTGKYMAIYNSSGAGVGMSNHSSLAAAQVVYVPAQRGDSIYISYTATGSTEYLRFIYAEGAQ